MAQPKPMKRPGGPGMGKGPGMGGHGMRGPGMRGPAVENPGRILRRILGYVGKYYGVHYIFVIVCIIISALANVQGTMFMRDLIDVFIVPLIGSANPDYSGLLHAMMKVGGFYLLGIGAAYAQAKIMAYVTQGTMKKLRIEMFNHMESLPIKYFDTNAHGDIMSLYTNDIDTLRQLISQSIPQCISSIITIVSVLISMIILNIPLTILTLFMVFVMMKTSMAVAGKSGKFFAAQQKDLGALNGYIEEMIEGQKVVKVFCHEEEAKADFKELNDKLYDSANNAHKFANVIGPINGQFGNMSYVLCAVLGGVLALNRVGGFTLGGLASFLTFNKNFSMPVNQVSQQMNSIVMAMAGADRIFKLLDEEPELDEGYVTLVNVREENGELVETEEHTGLWAWKHTHQADGTVSYVKLQGDVVFDMVDFGYNEDKIVLHDVEISATPGQKIAFVGSTGAGKTTITNLINRFYDIQDGKIRYDGININKIKKSDLRRSLGMVLHDTHLFSYTVIEDIRYRRLDSTD